MQVGDKVIVNKDGSTYGFEGRVASVGKRFADVTTRHPYWEGQLVTSTYRIEHLESLHG